MDVIFYMVFVVKLIRVEKDFTENVVMANLVVSVKALTMREGNIIIHANRQAFKERRILLP